jgi:hypothetical protein
VPRRDVETKERCAARAQLGELQQRFTLPQILLLLAENLVPENGSPHARAKFERGVLMDARRMLTTGTIPTEVETSRRRQG